jgi:acylphosphatase
MKICVKCLVSGRVQGVFFRASTREQALSLGIFGYARNLADGRVEVMACGERRAIDQFRSWLTRGPAAAQVTGVSCEPQDSLGYQSFTVQ